VERTEPTNCVACGRAYVLDFIVTPSVWDKIKPKNVPVDREHSLCPMCVAERLDALAAKSPHMPGTVFLLNMWFKDLFRAAAQEFKGKKRKQCK
jgi:hypothetical protein